MPKRHAVFNQDLIETKRLRVLRENQSENERAATQEQNKIQKANRRNNELPEQTVARQLANRSQNAARRNNEMPEQTIARQLANRSQNAARRNNEMPEQTIARQMANRSQNAARRNTETPEQTVARQMANRRQNAARRNTETPEQTIVRQITNRSQNAARRNIETPEQTIARQTRNRIQNAARRNEIRGQTIQRQGRLTVNNWLYIKDEAFKYDVTLNYANFPQIAIGAMTFKCKFCNAFKFKGETPGLCCSSGKVSLQPLHDLPEPLLSLLNSNHPKSNEFLNNIRKYNSCFQMTSFGTSVPRQHGQQFMPTFRIQGQVYHKAGSLLPMPNNDAKFLQIYFLGDEEHQIQRRCSIIPGTDRNLLESLQRMLHQHNHYIRTFKTALEENPSEDMKIIIKADKKPAGTHERVYNAPIVNQVAIIIVGNDFEKRDIVLKMRSNELRNISETHISYDALQYPLMFPFGEDGYAINLYQVHPGTSNATTKAVSAKSYYSYRLMIRPVENHLLNYKQLFHQYLVDMYAKIETERLLFIRLNQKELRVDEYIHLKDSVAADGNAQNHGQLVILPSTHTGGPRNMHEYAQDAITYVRHGGKPSLFITYTFNPNCKDLEENLINGQKKTDRHDLVARIFRQKLIKLINVLIKGQVFGPIKYWLYSVEWQKRGLPHAHILIWLTNGLNPNQIDDIISAEIPDRTIDEELYNIVVKNMVHGPCGDLNRRSPCMKDGRCTKKYPRKLINETQTAVDGYPLYRRRKPGEGGNMANVKVNSEFKDIDNRWIVPYSPLLLKMFNAHINVESCNSVKSIKYILKYVHKGSDQGVFAAHSGNNELDEIAEYQAGRYISSNEAAWRIFGFPIHERYPTVMHLDVHLENGQRIYFNVDNFQQQIINPPKTTLTGFFELCKADNFAKTLLYCEVPQFYTWDKRVKNNRKFERRKQGDIVEEYDGIHSNDALGRVYTVHLHNAECYYLRMLLHKVKGPTCFNDLRTVNEVLYDTYQAACVALGLLEDDNQWNESLREATQSDSPAKIRALFAIILTCCEVANPKMLWENHKESMSEDILNRLQQENIDLRIEYNGDIFNEALIAIENKVLDMTGKHLPQYGIPSPSRLTSENLNREILRELAYDAAEMNEYVRINEPLLNDDQRSIYLKILQNLRDKKEGVIFIDAPGGTGKTFLINLLLAKIRGQKKIALAMGSSGIAATLMTGGRTAHSTLSLPIDLIHNDVPMCGIKKNTGKATMLQQCKAIFWDEISMMHKHGLEALDRTLKDIRNNKTLMGGLTIVLAGDFRQTLPVIPRGTMLDQIKACIKSSYLWNHVECMKLKTNMRVQQSNDDKAKTFAEYLLSIGNGNEKVNLENGKIKLCDIFCNFCPNIQNLIEACYPNLILNIKNHNWLQERTILAPTNDKVDEINISIQSMMPEAEKIFYSIDKILNEDEATNFPVEFLNSLNPCGVPQHKLILKVGSPIMLLRNLDPPKLCNGTRLVIKAMHTYVIEAIIITGASRGEIVHIPRIPIIPSDFPFEFKRLQFPVRLAFAITINKSQGQSLQVTGINLREECFSHGQLYVATSRATNSDNLFVLADQNHSTKNIVYCQILN